MYTHVSAWEVADLCSAKAADDLRDNNLTGMLCIIVPGTMPGQLGIVSLRPELCKKSGKQTHLSCVTQLQATCAGSCQHSI